MSRNQGAYRTGLAELNDFADGRRASIESFPYGVVDGMISRECNAGSPGAIKSRDGQLWRRVLVADDAAANRGVVRSMLEPLGFEVTEAGNGAECLSPKQPGCSCRRQLRACPGDRPRGLLRAHVVAVDAEHF